MIDTVKLNFTNLDFHIVRPELFTPNASGVIQGLDSARNKQGRWETWQNPTKWDKDNGIYKPRITLTRRKHLSLKVEFSVPKLLFGNNFDELQNSDFDSVVTELRKKLGEMGVLVTKAAIERVELSHVDFSKNLVLDDYTTVSSILGLLSKGVYSKHSDLSERRFKDGGQALHLYNASNEVILYDKVAELFSSKARSIEKENKRDSLQMSLFEAIRDRGPPFEVLRIERRLKKKTVIKRVLVSHGLEPDLKFKSMFSSGLSKQIIQSIWSDLFTGIRPLLVEELDICDLIEAIANRRPKWTPQKVFAHAAFHFALLQKGDRRLDKAIWSRYHPRTRRRMLTSINDLDLPLDRVKSIPLFAIDEQIISYKPLKLINYDILPNGPKYYEQ